MLRSISSCLSVIYLIACFLVNGATVVCAQVPTGATLRATPPPRLPAAPSLAGLSPSVPSEWTQDPAIKHSIAVRPEDQQREKNRYMDIYSWQSFIALNWPVAPGSAPPSFGDDEQCHNGSKLSLYGSVPQPNSDRFPAEGRITATNCPRWMTWHRRREVVQGFPHVASSTCEDDSSVTPQPQNRLNFTSKVAFGDLLSDTKVPAKAEVPDVALVDQHGNKVYYDIVINNGAYCYLKTLNSSGSDVDLSFLKGEDDPKTASAPRSQLVGATELKFAWKILDPKDNAEQFIRREVSVPITSDNRTDSTKNCDTAPDACKWRKVQVGLVGLHVVHKTKDHDAWIWSTFEHVDNDPTEREASAAPDRTYSFFGSCATCPHNSEPSQNDVLTQLTRTEEIADDTAELNRQMQQELKTKGSVLQYYELIGTQYDPTNNLTSPEDTATPKTLRNTVIEAYTKNASCIGCHRGAFTQGSC